MQSGDRVEYFQGPGHYRSSMLGKIGTVLECDVGTNDRVRVCWDDQTNLLVRPENLKITVKYCKLKVGMKVFGNDTSFVSNLGKTGVITRATSSPHSDCLWQPRVCEVYYIKLDGSPEGAYDRDCWGHQLDVIGGGKVFNVKGKCAICLLECGGTCYAKW